MNLPRYKFAKESEPELLQFLKVARSQQLNQHKNLDSRSHEVWKKLLPLDSQILKKLEDETSNAKLTVIDISSDEEQVPPPIQSSSDTLLPRSDSVEEFGTDTTDKSTISDVAFAIKENLETENDLSNIIKEYLLNYDSSDLETLFEKLEETLSSEEIYYVGIALQNIVSEPLISIFCHSLLIIRIKKEYSEKLLQLMNEFSIKYASTLKGECLCALQDLGEEEVETFLHYIKKTNISFQSALVRDFILAIRRLNNNYLIIIENLLNGQVEYEALNKLVEMLSNVAEGYTRDKNFGKILMQTVEVLGPNVIHVEQPLKHIIAGHKSVWKSKLEKTFNTCYEDSLLFSQSFRD